MLSSFRFIKVTLLLVTSIALFAIAHAQERPKNVIIVGGSSGMGLAAARQVLQHGGHVLLVSRSVSKLERARDQLACPERTSIAAMDITDESQVQAFTLPPLDWDGLVITAAGRAPHEPVLTLETNHARTLLDSKLWGAYHCAKHWSPHLCDDGAVVLCAGILNRRPGVNCAPLAMANGALEGLTRTLALEWAPRLRVNCLSPGFCDTERFDHMDPSRKHAMLEHTASSLPLQKVGQPSDMGEAIYYLLTAPFCTGVVLDVDGGHGIRQYANPMNDPMRRNE
ncbi:hypothetical protein FisN_7Hh253 [Fistulifera solaris]|uniref:Ketoreductase domain-containing protein n=1 Tax=Fistulifera solaris TaxID=1519565 RepID=A0A1Z5KSI1_FISSO|nr:hypothetical protein FisN_7Hh253 [Fistulifera solaris]|eukprot:GAX29147.1 hypothetical protein FisN_7Hh253 [Fistulifera solaris]